MKTATLITRPNERQCLWQLSEALEGHEYVITSKPTRVAVGFTGPETYIFPANKQAEITEDIELRGSRRGDHSHEAVLEALGYTIIKGVVQA